MVCTRGNSGSPKARSAKAVSKQSKKGAALTKASQPPHLSLAFGEDRWPLRVTLASHGSTRERQRNRLRRLAGHDDHLFRLRFTRAVVHDAFKLQLVLTCRQAIKNEAAVVVRFCGFRDFAV